jgi:large subunit ribosomal protein L18
MPRLSVFKSNKYIYAQLIDDERGHTVASSSSATVKKGTMLEKAKETGRLLAETAGQNGIKKAVFDRGGFMYTGRIKAVAEGAREGGLKF